MKTNKIFATILSAIMFFGSSAFELLPPKKTNTLNVKAADIIENGKCGETAFWEFDDNGTLTISGTGAIYDWGSAYGPSAFESVVDRIEKVIIKDGIERIGWCNFEKCSKLSYINIADSVTEIGIAAFVGCSNLKEIKLPINLLKIEREAFMNCSSLSELVIPSSINIIENGIVRECSNLKAISIPEDNKRYSTVDGVLYDKNMNRLISYPCGKNE